MTRRCLTSKCWTLHENIPAKLWLHTLVLYLEFPQGFNCTIPLKSQTLLLPVPLVDLWHWPTRLLNFFFYYSLPLSKCLWRIFLIAQVNKTSSWANRASSSASIQRNRERRKEELRQRGKIDLNSRGWGSVWGEKFGNVISHELVWST